MPHTGYSPTATAAPAGPGMGQPQRKVDPDQMPSPVSAVCYVPPIPSLHSLTCTHVHTHTHYTYTTCTYIILIQVDVIEGDRESRGSTVYSTATRGIPPPLVTTEFTVEDNGMFVPVLPVTKCSLTTLFNPLTRIDQ